MNNRPTIDRFFPANRPISLGQSSDNHPISSETLKPLLPGTASLLLPHMVDEPEILAEEIIENIEAGLANFRAVAATLANSTS